MSQKILGKSQTFLRRMFSDYVLQISQTLPRNVPDSFQKQFRRDYQVMKCLIDPPCSDVEVQLAQYPDGCESGIMLVLPPPWHRAGGKAEHTEIESKNMTK